MAFGDEREKWFTFRSERLRTFMEAWLGAHAIKAISRPAWAEGAAPPDSENIAEGAAETGADDAPKSQSGRRSRNAETLRQHLKELAELLGPRDLDTIVSFGEFLKARRAARGFAHHHEHMLQERAAGAGDAVASRRRRGADREAGRRSPGHGACRAGRLRRSGRREPCEGRDGAGARGPRSGRRPLLCPRDGGHGAPALRGSANAGVRGAARVDGRETRRDWRRLSGQARARRPRASRGRGDAGEPRAQAHRGFPPNRRPSDDDLARVEQNLGAALFERLGGKAQVEAAAAAEQLDAAELDAILRRQALAAWYLDRAISPILQPSDEQLREVFRTSTHPYRGRPFDQVRADLARWFVMERVRAAETAFFQGARTRVVVVVTR